MGGFFWRLYIMSKLRIQRESIKIDVNDQGEFIELPLDDESFPKRVYALLENFQAKQEELNNQLEEINDITDGQAIDLNEEIHLFFKGEIDRVFGAETCRKVFGDITPSVGLLSQFFEQIEPYFEQFKQKKTAKLSKYSAGRVGNV